MSTDTAVNTAQAVSDYLAEQKILYGAVYGGETRLDDWKCDAWDVSLSSPKGALTRVDFFTGLGLRKPPRGRPYSWDNVQSKRDLAQWREKNSKPVPPSAASVLRSMLLDAQSGAETFKDFCANCGYSDDSIKALDVYKFCQEQEHKLRILLTHEQRTRLEGLLQDY